MKKFTEWLNVREALVVPGGISPQQTAQNKAIQMAYYDMAVSAGTVTPEMLKIYNQNKGNKVLITRLNNIDKMVQSGQLKPAPGVGNAAATSAPGAAPAQEPDPQRQAELLRQRVAMNQQLKKGSEQPGASRRLDW